jgi:ribosomal protein L24E
VEQENECDFSGDKIRKFENNMFQLENGKLFHTSERAV